MSDWLKAAGGWTVELETKPDMMECLERVYAWYAGEVLDRPPVRFARHNAEFEVGDGSDKSWPSLKDRWFDVEYQVEKAVRDAEEKKHNGETFPLYWPNLGPNVFAACYGMPYEFGEVTAWAHPMIKDMVRSGWPAIDWSSEYVKKLDELTQAAIDAAQGRFIVGYTDMHSGLDWCDALRGTTDILMDMLDDEALVEEFATYCQKDFFEFYDRYDGILKAAKQLSVTWMNIPAFGKLHIPSCDISSMVSRDMFEQFAMPCLISECEYMSHNIFHVDGKGVAQHIDQILTLPNLKAIQWVQGVGDDAPMIQWLPFVQKVLNANKGIVIDLAYDELDTYMEAIPCNGVYLTMATSSVEQEYEVLKKIKKWRRK